MGAFEEVVAQGKEKLSEGRLIIMFPEGTRIPVGQAGKYKSGGARLAVRTGAPVVPIAHNAGECWPRNAFIKKPGLVTVSIGPAIPTEGRDSEEVNKEEVQQWIESKCASLARTSMPPKPPDRSRMGKGVSAALQLVLPLFGAPREQDIPRPEPTQTDRRKTPADTALASGERLRQIRLSNQHVSYIFRRRSRKSIGFTVDRRGLVVSAPRWVTLTAVESAIQEKSNWILAKLQEWQNFETRLAELETDWIHGGRLR